MGRHVVAAVGEIAEGERKLVTLEGREIGVFNVKGEFYALLNKCPHSGAELCRGMVIGLAQSDEPGEYKLTRPGEFLRCPWHGWEFDIRTGQSWFDPQKVRTRTYKASVEPGAKLVKGPYVAETFPVRIEENYVVIDI
jgi:3-phenylpropionate/trans-cinnamate dioxygenase ferredoxin subunit